MNKNKQITGLAVVLAAFVVHASAQNTFPATGNVGIGTTSPGNALTVVGSTNPMVMSLSNTSSGGHIWGFGSFGTYAGYSTGGFGIADWTASQWRMYIDASGKVGIGTTSPEAPLAVANILANGLGTNESVNTAFWTGADVNLVVGGDLNGGSTAFLQVRAGGSASVIGPTNYQLALNPYGGSVGIGTVYPGAKLEVNGNIKLTSGSGASVTFADGTVQSTAYTGVTCGGDYAESVDVAGVRTSYGPGDVLVIGLDGGSDVVKSNEPYSTVVAGVYSTKPGVVGRRQTTDSKASKTEVPMAMIGIVPTKVSAENGPIKRGDLLVTSSIPGYAMKGTDRSRMLGAVIGKALGNLTSGTGVVEALIALQ